MRIGHVAVSGAMLTGLSARAVSLSPGRSEACDRDRDSGGCRHGGAAAPPQRERPASAGRLSSTAAHAAAPDQ
jgi:hypothetical protein